MTQPKSDLASKSLAMVAVVLAGILLPASALAQEPPPAPPSGAAALGECTVSLQHVGALSDILSNALARGLKVASRDVEAFLAGASDRYKTAPDLLKAAAEHFKIEPNVLAAKVEKYKHCNCAHAVESALHPNLRVGVRPQPECDIDLELAGTMSDVFSNALMHGLHVPAADVSAILTGADKKYEDGPEVFKATAAHFKISEDVLAVEALKFKHINCKHTGGGGKPQAPRPDDGLPISTFAKDVTLHVVLHEIGHALIREFDIPVLGNEECVADAFATYYLTAYLPERAVDVLVARTKSLMIEAGETPDVEWRGEHDDDARRAFQIAAIAVAADVEKYKPVAAVVGMSEGDIKKARDYGGEIRRSWRRVLGPLLMPEGTASPEARVVYDNESAFLTRVCKDGLADEVASSLRRFDWHSQVTVRFVDGTGRAGWNRSARTVTVHSDYVRRFIDQGRLESGKK